MVTLAPLEGYLAAPEHAAQVTAPAYDTLTEGERARFVAANQRNFLAVLPRAEYTDEAQLDDAVAALRRLIADGVYERRPRPFLLVYRLAVGTHVQTGVVGDVPVDEIVAGRVRAHEHTRRRREDHIVRFLERVGVASSPVCVTYRAEPSVDAAVTAVTTGPPDLAVRTGDGLDQRLWVVDDEATLTALRDAVAGIGTVYITDGHHRSAAAVRFAARQGVDGATEAGRLLVALFPDQQLRIVGFDRTVRVTLAEPAALRLRLEDARWTTERLPAPERPAEPRTVVAGFPDGWWRLRVTGPDPPAGPAARLDVSRLHHDVLGPLLGITDPRDDPRIGFLPGILPTTELERARRDGNLVFALRPPALDELMAVADAGEVMPPKSTYFVPKARSGLLLVFRHGPLR